MLLQTLTLSTCTVSAAVL
uniref:Uncharacterized protein n=1 Tax=Anguilla anguilla TaxID=7936 RepID=A0A0E9Q8P8_ANGAN